MADKLFFPFYHIKICIDIYVSLSFVYNLIHPWTRKQSCSGIVHAVIEPSADSILRVRSPRLLHPFPRGARIVCWSGSLRSVGKYNVKVSLRAVDAVTW